MRGIVYSGMLLKPEFKGDQFLLPDESPEEYAALCKALIDELSPQTRYQRRLAENLVQIEWEIMRHRRLIATHVAVEAAQTLGAEQSGATNRLWTMRPEVYGEEEEGSDEEQDKEVDDPAEALMSFDPTRWVAVDTGLKRKGGSLRATVAEAYRARIDDIQYHEYRVVDLERRRRSLLQDYQRLQDTRPLSKLPVVEQ